ncbi:MAG: molecular chaperone DnaJ [Acidimicrobiia bacterium]
MADYYEVLGVSRDASADEIKRRFRTLARETHPDANPDDPAAEARFRQIAEAYEVLSDEARRAAYDRGERFGTDLFSAGATLEEILSQFFGAGFGGFGGFTSHPARRKGRDLSVAVDLTLDEAATGVAREVTYRSAITCDTCSGAGSAPGASPTRCGACGGTGHVRVTRSTFLGSMMTVAECSTCSGWGEVIADPCPACSGRGRVDDSVTVTIDIPAGVDHGTRLRLGGRGEAGERRTPAGDLYASVRVAADERFERLGDDLHHRVRLGLAEATLGVDLKVPLVGGEFLDVEIPAGTQPGTVFKIDRQGMPRLRRRGRGDLLIEVQVMVPTDLTDEQTEALRHYAELRGESPAVPRKKRRFFAG